MLSMNQSQRLINHVIRSYARLSENSRVKPILKENLPQFFRDPSCIKNLDEIAKKWLENFFNNLEIEKDESKELNLSKK